MEMIFSSIKCLLKIPPLICKRLSKSLYSSKIQMPSAIPPTLWKNASYVGSLSIRTHHTRQIRICWFSGVYSVPVVQLNE